MRKRLRVARIAVVLIEPLSLYELATEPQRARMREHSYVRSLGAAADELSCDVVDFQLLPVSPNPLNPSGRLVLLKPDPVSLTADSSWQCSISHTPLVETKSSYFAPAMVRAYRRLDCFPLLRESHAEIAL